MNIYLPIAEVSINLFFLIGLGALVGFLSGLFGVGGGFIMTPLLMMAGIPPAVAAASDCNQIVAGAASGAYAHWRLGNVDFKMGIILLLGGITGGTIGVQLVKVLRELGNIEFVMKVVYVVLLFTIGGAMFVESLRTILASRRKAAVQKKVEQQKRSSFLGKAPFANGVQTIWNQDIRYLPLLYCLVRWVHCCVAGGWWRIHHGPCHDRYHRDANHSCGRH
jgi:uncharacterized membrane protein YfcA